MNKILLLSLILVIAFSWKINQPSFVIPGIAKNSQSQLSNLQSCSSSQLNTATVSITVCQSYVRSKTAECIRDYLHSRLAQKWNVYIEQSSSTDYVAYWSFAGCNVTLQNYGKQNFSYKLWPSDKYTVQSSQNVYNNHGLVSMNNVGCEASRVQAVKNAINSCDHQEEDEDAADCIQDQLKAKLNQYWDVYVSAMASSSVYYWPYSGCDLTYDDYGKYQRDFKIWKAL